MRRNIVICSDGTGNTFSQSTTNVSRIVSLLALDDASKQVVVYDQGVGTDGARVADIRQLHPPDAKALEFLPGGRFPGGPARRPALGLSLVFGIGIKANVREMYLRLATLVCSDEDRVFLFGFSRGAFTVRALAGLIYRCGLPPQGAAKADAAFERAWQLFQPAQRNAPAIARFRDEFGQRPCPIHFLGAWDTVKSYGTLRPILLPHLRHNPAVATVRHALALDERRGWFGATTWGRLDLDLDPDPRRDCAWKRLTPEEQRVIEKQDIKEVWFAGSHSDVGGGVKERETANVALQWMLGEAVTQGNTLNAEGEALTQGITLNAEGESFLRVRAEVQDLHDSRSKVWSLADLLPRLQPNNGGRWPKREYARGSGERDPGKLLRGESIAVHESVKDAAARFADGPRFTVEKTSLIGGQR